MRSPWHSRRCRFRLYVRHASTFLGPFAPRPLQALRRSYGPSDACSGGSSALASMNTGLYPAEQASLLHVHSLPVHSVATHRVPRVVAFARYPSARRASRLPEGWTSPFLGQARRESPAESRSSSYGLVSHLRLLPTSPRGDAVTIGLQAGERMPWGGLPPPWLCTLTGAP